MSASSAPSSMSFWFCCYGAHPALPSFLHDALPIFAGGAAASVAADGTWILRARGHGPARAHGHERSEEHTSELQSHSDLVCRLLLEKKKNGARGIPLTTRLEHAFLHTAPVLARDLR